MHTVVNGQSHLLDNDYMRHSKDYSRDTRMASRILREDFYIFQEDLRREINSLFACITILNWDLSIYYQSMKNDEQTVAHRFSFFLL